MRKLTLVGLSADGRLIVFVDDAGVEHAAPADDRLRAALRGDRARLGQLEIEMDSALRPRDIQARIRGGESAEAVAVLAQVSLEKIMPYCVPVLAERQHVAGLAQRSHVRRKNVEGPSRRLADVVTERLRGRGVDPGSADWDAWRRDDGRWSVQTRYHSGESERAALFVFDAIGRFSLADDDEAKWLTGERQSTSKGPQPRHGGGRTEGDAKSRRLSSVPNTNDLLSLGSSDDVDASYEEDTTDDLTAVVRAVQDSPATSLDDASTASSDDMSTADADHQNHHPGGADDEYVAAEGDADQRDADDPVGIGAAAESPIVDEPEAESQAAPPDPPVDDPAATGPESDMTGEEAAETPPAKATAQETAAVDPPGTEPTRERRRRGRASVPSWDEIMLGGKGRDD